MIDSRIMLSGAGSGDDCAVALEGASLRVRDRRITGIRRGSLECFRIRFCVVERHDCGLSLLGHGHRLNPRHRLEARLNGMGACSAEHVLYRQRNGPLRRKCDRGADQANGECGGDKVLHHLVCSVGHDSR